jgi:hypothetical protein
MVLPVTSLDQLFGARTAMIVDGNVEAPRLDGWQRYTLLDRGSYEWTMVDAPALFATLAARASTLVGRGLSITQARAVKLVPGDYIFAHHDHMHDDLPVELVLDLSPASVPAEIHYRRRGNVFFRVPCVPGSLAIVELGPTVTRNHTYVSKLHAGAVVVRLVMLASSVA